jgi:hypothetical protein
MAQPNIPMIKTIPITKVAQIDLVLYQLVSVNLDNIDKAKY